MKQKPKICPCSQATEYLAYQKIMALIIYGLLTSQLYEAPNLSDKLIIHEQITKKKIMLNECLYI